MTVFRFSLKLVLLLVLPLTATAQSGSGSAKSYRGTIGDKHIEMRLTIAGNNVSGTYSYDQFRQEIKLAGSVQSNGQLQFTETAPGMKKPSGQFLCKTKPENFEADLECDWSRIDGSGKAVVVLYEQFIDAGIDVTPKMFNDWRSKVTISYPRIANPLPGADAFNELIVGLAKQSVKDNFSPESPGTGVFDTSYVLLFASPQFLSIEMQEYSDVGAAHPNTRLWTVNYDLKAQRQISLEELFREKSDYKTVIAEYVASDINRRAQQMDDDEAKRNGTQPQKREEPLMSSSELPQIAGWAASRKGLAIYFDFPHAMAVFDETIVPYEILRSHFKSDGSVKLFMR